MPVTIKEVTTKKQLKQFVWFGINLYKDNEYAAPPLFVDDYTNLTKGKNPSLDFCEAAYFLAHNEKNEIVGRIAAIINPVANETWNQKNARFGWIDFIDDYEVSKALFDTAVAWAKPKA